MIPLVLDLFLLPRIRAFFYTFSLISGAFARFFSFQGLAASFAPKDLLLLWFFLSASRLPFEDPSFVQLIYSDRSLRSCFEAFPGSCASTSISR